MAWRDTALRRPACPEGGVLPESRSCCETHKLLAGFDLGGNQSDLIDTCGMRDVNYLGYLIKRQIRIRLDKHDLFGAGLENVVQTTFQIVPRHVVLIDLQGCPVA